MTAAAFRASYTDWRVIKGRKVVSVSFEVPIEHADLAYQALGGMPNPASEVWCGIARIDPNAGAGERTASRLTSLEPEDGAGSPGERHALAPDVFPIDEVAGASDEPAPGRQSKKRWNEFPPQQQAAIIGGEPAFWSFVREQHECNVTNKDEAKEFIYQFCDILSRKELEHKHTARVLWHGLADQYRTWEVAERCGAI